MNREPEALEALLGEKYTVLEIVGKCRLEEDLLASRADVSCVLRCSNLPETHIAGYGVGLVDALFHALKGHLAGYYPSLEKMCFVKFVIKGDFSVKRDEGAHSDAAGHVEMTIQHSANGESRTFRHTGTSVSGCSVSVVLTAVSHCINVELASTLEKEVSEPAQAMLAEPVPAGV